MVDRLIRELEQGQNADGGWGYDRGTSWTEPTSFSLLALNACGGSASAQAGGRQWLRSRQMPDGGWTPSATIPISTWVTTLAVIALETSPSNGSPVEHAESRAIQRAVEWIYAQAGARRVGLEELRKWFLGSARTDPEGWSFFPGTASWVMPTSLAILALSKSPGFKQQAALVERVAHARSFLLSRRCADGGWNHGGSVASGESAASYPETTGMALLALQGGAPADLKRSLTLAENWLARTNSVEAQSWLRIGLSAYGRSPAGPEINTRCRTNYDRSLLLLAEACRLRKNGFAAGMA